MRFLLRSICAVVAMVAVIGVANTSQAALVVGATFGSADKIDDINNTGVSNFSNGGLSGPFADAWTFETGTDLDLGISALAAAFNLPPLSSIADFEIGLVEAGTAGGGVFSGGEIVAVGTLSGGFLTFSYAGLLTETLYAIVVLGTGTSGFYAGNVTVSAVPLPAAAWLFLSALVGLVGVIGQRRRASTADHRMGGAAVG